MVADVVRATGHRLAGYADADVAKMGRVVEPGGGTVVVSQEQLVATVRATGRLPDGFDALALAVGANRARERLLRLLEGVAVPSLVAPTATVSGSARVGRGSVVFPGAVVNAAARIGDAVIVNTAAVVEHDCSIGDAAHVSPGAVLAGGVSVGPRGWIGAGAVVIPGVSIGEDAVVGAGAVVIRDVPAGTTVVGNPARQISRQRNQIR